jgi:hypothetical protein
MFIQQEVNMMKKLLVVSITLILLFTSMLPECSCEGTTSGETAGSVKIPDGPRIKVVYNGPPELDVKWEKLEYDDLDWAISIVGILTNISDRIVDFSMIFYFVDRSQVGWNHHTSNLFSGNELMPGEQWRFTNSIQVLGNFSEDHNVLEVRITGLESKTGSSSTTKTQTKQTTEETTNSYELASSLNAQLLQMHEQVMAGIKVDIFQLCDIMDRLGQLKETFCVQTIVNAYKYQGYGGDARGCARRAILKIGKDSLPELISSLEDIKVWYYSNEARSYYQKVYGHYLTDEELSNLKGWAVKYIQDLIDEIENST